MTKKLCSNCHHWYNSEGISDLCPSCRRRKASSNLMAEDRNTTFGKAYKMMGSADTNIFTAPGKAIFGAVNAGKKISKSMDEFNEGMDQIKESLSQMNAEAELKARKIALANTYKKARYDSMNEDEQRSLDEQANLETNQSLCLAMGFLMGVIATICGIIYGDWTWYISFVFLPIPIVICYFLRSISLFGYIAAAFDVAVILGGIICGALKIVSFFVDVPSFWYVLVPFVCAIIGVIGRVLQSKNEGYTLLSLTEDEQDEVDALDYE